jgi:hypothetical protein
LLFGHGNYGRDRLPKIGHPVNVWQCSRSKIDGARCSQTGAPSPNISSEAGAVHAMSTGNRPSIRSSASATSSQRPPDRSTSHATANTQRADDRDGRQPTNDACEHHVEDWDAVSL